MIKQSLKEIIETNKLKVTYDSELDPSATKKKKQYALRKLAKQNGA